MENKNTSVTEGGQIPRFRPKFEFVHANAKGTGSAVSFEMVPAYNDVDGCVWVRFFNQTSIADRSGSEPVYARFDRENPIITKLGFNDLTKMLQVFRGECESLDGDKGLFHRYAGGQTVIKLTHLVSPYSGYVFEVARYSGGGDSGSKIFLAPHEALGLAAAIEGSLAVLCFGIPMVYERSYEAWYEEKRRERNAVAA